MTQEQIFCRKPENLKGRPGECSPEQIEQCHGQEKDHGCDPPSDEKVLQAIKEQMGFLPKPLVLMSQRPGLLGQFLSYGKTLFEGGPLTDRERFLVALSAAAALKSTDCMSAHSRRALDAGATREEVLQAVLIAGMISNTSALHLAYQAVGNLQENGVSS